MCVMFYDFRWYRSRNIFGDSIHLDASIGGRYFIDVERVSNEILKNNSVFEIERTGIIRFLWHSKQEQNNKKSSYQ